jgi:MSHA biogenesis protein MshP
MKKFQRGFSIVSAIFLLVVLAVLGAAMTTFSTAQHQSAALDVLGSRAYQAARAGIEWAAYNVAQTPASSPTAWAGCAPAQTVAIAGDLAMFSPVTVNCSATSSAEGASTIWIYDVSAVAQTNGAAAGDQNYVQRVITVKLGR